MEKLVAVAKIYDTGRPDSLIVVVPAEVRKLLRIKKGERVAVKVDGRGRWIYERIDKPEKNSNHGNPETMMKNKKEAAQEGKTSRVKGNC